MRAPLLFCIGFIFNFVIGGITGVFEAAVPVDLLLHDTYQVVSHFHDVIMGSIAFAIFAGVYYWFPIYTGRLYQRTLAKWHFWTTMIGTNLTFFPMIVLGYAGMPRRYATDTVAVGPVELFASLHQIATLGALLLLLGQIIFVWNIVQSWLGGPEVTDGDPWGLAESGREEREFRWFSDKLATRIYDGGEALESGLRPLPGDPPGGPDE